MEHFYLLIVARTFYLQVVTCERSQSTRRDISVLMVLYPPMRELQQNVVFNATLSEIQFLQTCWHSRRSCTLQITAATRVWVERILNSTNKRQFTAGNGSLQRVT